MTDINYSKIYSYKTYKQCFLEEPAHKRIISNIAKFIGLRMGLSYSNPNISACDILFLHSGGGIVQKRVNFFAERLKQRGFKIRHDSIHKAKKAIIHRLLKKPINSVPFELSFHAAYAEYTIEKYQPKILLTFMDCDVISFFLKDKMKHYGKVINIAHGVSANTHRHSMFDFDYLFLLGRSSLDNILKNPFRFGNTKAVLSGSIFVGEYFSLPPNKEMKNILFFSSWIPGESREIVLKNFSIVADYARHHKEYDFFIKLHPLENPSIWEKKAKDINNIQILAQNIEMKEALNCVSLVLHQWSNASIEAALLNRPSISVDVRDTPDNYLLYNCFFTPKATNVSELHERINEVFENYDHYLKQCDAYASYHLEHRYAVDYICDCIESIYHGREDFPVHIINETGF